MVENLSLFELASALARRASLRHRVIAENLANADTPGYRARDVEDFPATVKEGFSARATRPEHAGQADILRVPSIVELPLAPAPNGNSVSVEDQAVRATEAQGQHAMALAVYAKAVDILRLGLGRAR